MHLIRETSLSVFRFELVCLCFEQSLLSLRTSLYLKQLLAKGMLLLWICIHFHKEFFRIGKRHTKMPVKIVHGACKFSHRMLMFVQGFPCN